MSRRPFWLPLGVLLTVGLLTATIALTAVGSGITSPQGCAPPARGTTTTSHVVAGLPLDAGQLANAWTIYTVGARLGLPERAAVVAIATALQESALENLPFGTSDSVGLFQQRPSQGWGSAAQIMDPVYAAQAFYKRLEEVAGWQSLPVTVAAQDVQRSALPSAYAHWEDPASQLVSYFSGGNGACAVMAADPVAAGATTSLPRDFSLPPGTPLAVVLAIRFAVAQIGTSYQFGGSCTDAHSPDMALHCDCSSLVQQAYRAGGIPLPRTTFAQVGVGTPVSSMGALLPGDLLFIAGADGTPTSPGHVGMYIGDGLVIQAPQTGQDVHLDSVNLWASLVVDMRRIA
jgi:cell wall-associated NlpC family hydrolase